MDHWLVTFVNIFLGTIGKLRCNLQTVDTEAFWTVFVRPWLSRQSEALKEMRHVWLNTMGIHSRASRWVQSYGFIFTALFIVNNQKVLATSSGETETHSLKNEFPDHFSSSKESENLTKRHEAE